MTNPDLDELERLHAKSTPGEWRYLFHLDRDARLLTALYAHDGRRSIHLTADDGDWITSLHDMAPKLIAELREARATIQRVHRLLQADEMGLKTYGITRDDLRAALAGDE